MIQVYDPGNKNFDWNGEPLEPTECSLTFELNGAYEIELHHPYDPEGKWKAIKEDSVIMAPTPEGADQPFRIQEIEKNNDEVIAYARHKIINDLPATMLIDTRPTLKNGQQALDIILEGSGIKGQSNITIVNTAYYIRKNALEALASDDDQSFINRWGGERFYNGDTLIINDHIGHDSGVSVEYQKNLTGIEANVDLNPVVTRIIPLGYDGLMLGGKTPWVDSPLIDKYVKVHPQVIEYSDVKVKDDPEDPDEEGFASTAEAQAELRRLAALEYAENEIDKPTMTINVDFVQLVDTIEYGEFASLETIGGGDVVRVRHRELDIEEKLRCVAYTWDCVSQKYTSMTLGDARLNYMDLQNSVADKVNHFTNPNGTLKSDYLNGTINAMNVKFKAQRDIAKKQHVRAMLFEDLDPDSSTYGAMSIGTMGFEIADHRTPDGKEWEWSTFGTGKGFTASMLVLGMLAGNCVEIDLEGGNILIGERDAKGHISQPDFSYIRGKGLEMSIGGQNLEETLQGIGTRMDGYIQTWYQGTDPSTDWTTTLLKQQHTGDYWYCTAAGQNQNKTFRWNGTSWAFQNAPKEVFDVIDQKKRIFVNTPITPYETGDLWTQGPTGELMVCRTTRISGVFVVGDWVKASKYTDDTALNHFIEGAFADSVKEIQTQIDQKAETWYQGTDPSTDWTTTLLKQQHTGDYWYCTAAGQNQNKTFRWNGTSWAQMNIPTAVFDQIDGKNSIYISQPSNYEKNDLWILSAATTVNGVRYDYGEVLTASSSSSRFEPSHWSKKISYTDDSSLENFIEVVYNQEVTPENFANGVGEAITNGSAAVDTPKFKFNKEGITVKNGGIQIQNAAGQKAFFADVDGNLTLTGNLKGCQITGSDIAIEKKNGTYIHLGTKGFSIDSRKVPLENGVVSTGLLSIDDMGIDLLCENSNVAMLLGQVHIKPTLISIENKDGKASVGNFGLDAILRPFSFTNKKTNETTYALMTNNSIEKLWFEWNVLGTSYVKFKDNLGATYRIPVERI